MFQSVSALVLASLLALSAAGEASAFSRQGTVTGPRGTASVHAQAGCAAGTCSRSITRTGPSGATLSRKGVVTCTDGSCSGSRTTTGPRGNIVTRSGSIQRY